MSWKIIEKYRKRVAGETAPSPKDWGGKLTVCLVFPNRYAVGMSNLGFQSVHSYLNSHDDVVCERSFFPDTDELREYGKSGTRMLSLESQRPLADFDVLAFSVSFENDYLNVPVIMELAGIPVFSSERTESSPLVLGGGAALTLNPEPVADFFDLICIGEAEAVLPPLLELFRGREAFGRKKICESCLKIEGIYVPSFYSFEYDGVGVTGIRSVNGAPLPVKRKWLPDLDRTPTVSSLLSEEAEFSDMYLIEVSRGCPRGCRFCAAGFMYLPYRFRSLEKLKEQAEEGLRHRRKIGLVGAAVSDYRWIDELCAHILQAEGHVSVSSLRMDALGEGMIGVLKASGHKTLSLAPEGGSQRLRDLIRKNITEEQILDACDLLVSRGILNLKLYFIIGLPTETMSDLEEMTALVEKIRARVIEAGRETGRLGEIILSVNPFVPKPCTPFQWFGMEDLKSLEKKCGYLRQSFGRLSNLRLKVESLKDAYLQALLSRGDRRLSRFLMRSHELGSWKRGAKDLAFPADDLVYRIIPPEDKLPWDVIDCGSRERLLMERADASEEGGACSGDWRC